MAALTEAEAGETEQPRRTGGGMAFADLIGSVPREAFFADYWERRPLHIRRSDGGYYDSLLTRTAVETVIASGGVRYPAVQLTRDGRYIPPEAFTQKVEGLAGALDQDRLAALYRTGATISMPYFHLAWKPLADFAAAIEAELDHPVQTNVYVTPGGCQGFGPHYDTHEVFVLQIAGHKRWRVHAPPAPLPHNTQPFSAQPLLPTPQVFEVDLNPRDQLYLPRGFVHSTATSRASSLHVTLGVTVFTWVELLAEWFQASKMYPRYRRALPPGFANDPAIRQRLKEDLPKIIAELQQLTDYDALVEAFARRVHSGALRPAEPFRTEVMAEPVRTADGAKPR
jgi:ribosomal protein L16 Arg81 hydroxylase